MSNNGEKPKQKDLMYWLKIVSISLPIVLSVLEFFGVTNLRDLFKKESDFNTVIILDGSAAMANFLPDGTLKFDAAKQAIENTTFGKKENVALRLFGGPCQPQGDERNTWRAVDFDKNNKDAITDALVKRKESGLAGEAALTDAIIEAITDDLAAKVLKGKQKKMIVIAAGAECKGNPAREIKKKLDEYDSSGEIAREIQLIGMDLEETQRNIFREIAGVTGKKALFVDDRIDLEIALYNSEVADTFLIAKENWLFKLGKDTQATNLLKKVIQEGRTLRETPSWTYEAMRLLGEIYQSDTAPHDEQEAIKWFSESAEGGNAEARAKLAAIILNGKAEKDGYPNALIWLTEAAQSGNPKAMYWLARAYDDETAWETNLKSARIWYAKAAEAFKEMAEKTRNSARKAAYKYGSNQAMKRIETIDDKLLTIK